MFFFCIFWQVPLFCFARFIMTLLLFPPFSSPGLVVAKKNPFLFLLIALLSCIYPYFFTPYSLSFDFDHPFAFFRNSKPGGVFSLLYLQPLRRSRGPLGFLVTSLLLPEPHHSRQCKGIFCAGFPPPLFPKAFTGLGAILLSLWHPPPFSR